MAQRQAASVRIWKANQRRTEPLSSNYIWLLSSHSTQLSIGTVVTSIEELAQIEQARLVGLDRSVITTLLSTGTIAQPETTGAGFEALERFITPTTIPQAETIKTQHYAAHEGSIV